MIYLKQNIWWIGLALTILIALYPTVFSSLGNNVKAFISKYWLQVSIMIIIILLCNLQIQLK